MIKLFLINKARILRVYHANGTKQTNIIQIITHSKNKNKAILLLIIINTHILTRVLTWYSDEIFKKEFYLYNTCFETNIVVNYKSFKMASIACDTCPIFRLSLLFFIIPAAA